ncbi:MAG: hypothetical protein AAF542_12355 [Pseudomonadota bacterium]
MLNKLVGVLVCLALLLGSSVSDLAIAQEDDDFIILDDRGLGESEEGDVELSGRSAPVGQTRPRAEADDDGVGPVKVPEDSGSDKPPPRRFEPTERVSEDLSVSFPADI